MQSGHELLSDGNMSFPDPERDAVLASSWGRKAFLDTDTFKSSAGQGLIVTELHWQGQAH